MMKLNTAGILLSILISSAAYANDSHYEQALTAYNQDKIEDAFIHLKNALQENPNSLHTKLLFAEVLTAKKLYKEAELELTEALNMGADVNLVVEPLTNVLLYRGQFTKILSLFNSYPLSRQSEYQYQFAIAQAYTGLEDYDNALKIYQDLSKQYPNNLEVQLGIISVYFSTGQLELAESNLEPLKPLATTNEKISRYIATLAFERGDLAAALLYFKQANQLDPDSIQSIHGVVNTLISLQKYEEAKPWVETLTELTPYDPQARLLQAIVLAESDEDEKANQLLSVLSEQLSTVEQTFMLSQPQLLLIDAMASYRQQNWEQASKKFQLYIRHAKEQMDIQAVVLLADVYNKLDRSQQSLELLSRYEDELIKHKDFALLLAGAYLKHNRRYDADKLLTQLRELYGSDSGVMVLSSHDLINRGQTEQAINMLTGSNIEQSDNYKHTLAAMYLNSGVFDKSLELSSELAKSHSENVEYQLLKIKAQIGLRLIDDAEQGLTELYQAHPNMPEVQLEYARLLFNKDQKEEAKKELAKLAKAYPEDGIYRLSLAEVEYSLGQIQSSVQSLQRLTNNPDYQIQSLHKLSLIYFQYREFELSLETANQIIKEDPVDLDAMFTRARALTELGRTDAAKAQCDKLYSWWLDDARNLYKLSQLQTQLSLYGDANKSLMKAHSLAQNNELVLSSIVKNNIKQNKLIEAYSFIAQMEEKQHDPVRITLLKGELEQAKGNIDLAFKYYSNVLAKEETNVIAFMNLRKLSRHEGYPENFAKIAENIVSKYPDKSFYRAKLADHLMWMGNNEQAKYHYQILLTKRVPRNELALAMNNLAVIYINDGYLEQAVQMSQQAVKLYPQTPAFIDTAGWALVKSGEAQQGLEQLRQAYSMNSSDPEVLYHLAYTLHKLDKKSEAESMLNKLKFFPEDNKYRLLAESL
ncbi:tetratricopeptide repeat protein [Vibrio sp. HN007]|uniref:tetratricopeptide repeat protein n=1 Tax=Vibrio iocasae TaxID=3098914 RepID=UPI0035D3E681